MAPRPDGVTAAGAHALPATALARAYRERAVSPIVVLDTLDERTGRIDPSINALVTSDPSARQQAAASARRFAAGTPLGPLDGIPVAVKDNLVVRGLRTTWGTPGFANYVPDHDELPVARLRSAGAVIVGKTNVPEFTLEGYTANPLFGVTRNPWDVALTPGGSSGGSAAGCAAGLFPLALCTDGGGSIRRPAAHTGVVGFKPSIGAIPRGDGLPSLLLDFEVVGPIGRSVDDAALLFDALRGPDARDRSSLAVQRAVPIERSARIIAMSTIADAPVDAQIGANFEQCLVALERAGHRIERTAFPIDLQDVNAFWPLVGQASLARAFAADPALRAGASARYREMAEHGDRVTAARFIEGMEAVSIFRRRIAALFENIDFVVTPTTAALPWPAEEAFPPRIDGREAGPRGHAIFTGWVNVCGHPAISVPCGVSREGLPLGLQIVGAFGADDAVIAFARAFEVLVGAAATPIEPRG